MAYIIDIKKDFVSVQMHSGKTIRIPTSNVLYENPEVDDLVKVTKDKNGNRYIRFVEEEVDDDIDFTNTMPINTASYNQASGPINTVPPAPSVNRQHISYIPPQYNGPITTCRKCQTPFPSNLKTCPACGAKVKKTFYKRWWFILIILFLLFRTCATLYKPNTATPTVDSTTDTSETVKETISFEVPEQVIFEGNDITIKAMGVESGSFGYKVMIYIENNSALDLSINAHGYAINGIMTNNNIYDMRTEVAAGKKANTELELSKSWIEEHGITTVRCIDMLIWAYDNAKNFKSFDTGQIEIQTTLYNGTHDTITGSNIYSEENINVDYFSDDGKNFTFVVTNNSGTLFDYDVENISINDFTTSDVDFDLMSLVTLNKCQSIFTIKVDDEFKNTNGITDVNSIEYNLSVRPNEDYQGSYTTDKIKWNR